MKQQSQSIPPFQPGQEPTGVVAPRSVDVIELQRQMRSPKLPPWEHPNKVLVVPRTKVVRGWGE